MVGDDDCLTPTSSWPLTRTEPRPRRSGLPI